MSDRYRTLLLLRHAKSDYPSGISDHERPLAERGVREAALVGNWIRSSVGSVDAVLCSTATRTRQTLTRANIDAPVRYADRIYNSTPGVVIDEINGIADWLDSGVDPATLLVVGHEPVMSALALGLADEKTRSGATADAILEKFPTSSVAVLRTARPWSELELGSAELVDFHTAR